MVNYPTVLILVLDLASDSEMGSTDCIPTILINYKGRLILLYECNLRVGAKEDSCNQLQQSAKISFFVLQDDHICITVTFVPPNAVENILNQRVNTLL